MAVSYGVGRRPGLDPLLVKVGGGPAATARINPCPGEPPGGGGGAKKKKKKKKKKSCGTGHRHSLDLAFNP